MEKTLSYAKTIKDFIILTKPGIVLMSVMTALTGLYVGHRGFPDAAISFWTLLGTGLAAAGATSLNNFYDRDIDVIMERTRQRPIPQGDIKPSTALILGIALIISSLFVFVYFINTLSAIMAMTAAFFYVVVYTRLKRQTPNATVIGGVSGALPPVIGVTALSGTVTIEALILFLIMFVWQPPHFWFLAIKHAEDYRSADIPTMPVSKGLPHTKAKILSFNIALFFVSLLPYFYGISGKVYLLTAAALSLAYVFFSFRLLFSKGEKDVFRFFYYSIIYLLVLFMVMVMDMQP
ncbi:MAG: protoheme IX farnesyltransferase, partial [Nitrospirae bacterium]|nr:protoheme IX farnesyltransferase [Nitrospirota bacterium]